MKRFVILAALAAMVFGTVSLASAVETTFKGQFDFAFTWGDNYATDDNGNGAFQDMDDDGLSEDDFGARQRLRLQMDFIASEQLKGVFYIESGETVWGNPASVGRSSGGAVGADGVSIEVKRAYVEFLVPNTALTFKVGIQGVILPQVGPSSPIFDDDVAGVVASYGVSDDISIGAMWLRPLDLEGDVVGDSPAAEELDAFGLYAAMNFEGFAMTPYVVFAMAGQDLGATSMSPAAPDDDVFGWWLGTTFELSMFDPFYFAMDLVYGNASADDEAFDRSGWFIQALLSYDLGYMTPALAAWYGSGDDDDAGDGSETLPSLVPDQYATSFGGDIYSTLGSPVLLGDTFAGSWGVALLLQDISFIEDLTHQFRIAYITGTADENAPGVPSSVLGNTGLTEEDHAIEVNFDSKYMIYDELALMLDLGYINVDIERADDLEDAWRMAIGLQYKF